MPPRVTVGLPVYNGENFLREAIDSILAQTFVDFELVISDNASTDSTQRICEEFAARDDRIRYFREDTNRGGSWNFHRVVELARGEYFRWAAHDDVVRPTYLERCVQVLDGDPSVVLCHTAVELIDARGKSLGVHRDPPLRRESSEAHVRFRDFAILGGRNHEIFGLIRRDALFLIPRYGSHANADGVLLARLSLIGRFVELDDVLQLMRVHEAQASTRYGVNRGIDYQAWREWIHGSDSGKPGLPHWRVWGEHARSLVVVKGLPLAVRMRSLPTLPVWAWTRRGRMKRDVIVAGRQVIGTNVGRLRRRRRPMSD
jgi:glycosyltransferase involved in cell wall biosynthesis